MSLVVAFCGTESAVVVTDGRAVVQTKTGYTPIESALKKVRRTRSGQLIAYVGVLSCVSRVERLADEFCGTLSELRHAAARILDEIDPAEYSGGFLEDGAPYGILQTLIIGRDDDRKLRAFHDGVLKDGTRDRGEHASNTRIALGFTEKIDPELEMLDKTLGSQALTVPVTVGILTDFIREIERRFPVEVGGMVHVEMIHELELRDSASCAHIPALAVANGLIKAAHISNQGVGQITQGSNLVQATNIGGTGAGWVLVGTALIDIPSGTASITLETTYVSTGAGASAGYIPEYTGFSIYSGSAPASPQVSSSVISSSPQTWSLTLNSPTVGNGLTVGLYVYWASSGAYIDGTFGLAQNVMQLLTAGALT